MAKIFLVIPTIKLGGAERVMTELANQWVSENNIVHLILLAEGEQFYKLHKNIIVYQLGLRNSNALIKFYNIFKIFIKFRMILKNNKPDFVLSFMDRYNVLTILASSFLNLKVFISDRSNPKSKIPNQLYILKKFTYRFATGIIAQTSLANEIIYSNYKNKNIKTIPNPIKLVKFYPEINREKIIINVGRLVPEKGQKYLIEAFSKIIDPEWKLFILGDGPLLGILNKQIEDLGIKERVTLVGAVSNVDEWLAKSSIFAFTSISEGFPNSLVEAMCAGLAVVSYDCDAGPRDIIINKFNGVIIENKSINELTDVLRNLILDDCMREKIGEQAKEIKNRLNVKFIAKEYLDFFKASSS